MDESEIPPESRGRRRTSSRKRRHWRWIIGLLVIAGLGLIGFGGWSAYQNIRQNRAVTRAQALLKAGDYAQAGMSATWALQLNQKDKEATHVMAEIAAALGQKQEVAWRGRLVELSPKEPGPRLKWALAALTHGEVSIAQDAIAPLIGEQRTSADYHDVAARLAARLRRGKELEASVAESVRLQPDNELYQLELAALRLGSQREETREVAREEIERLVEKTKTSRPALHVLIRDARMRGDTARGLAFAEKLNALPGANFEDRMSYLRQLRQLNRREFWWCLAQMQSEALESENEIPALMTYLNKSGMPGATVLWAKKLSEEARAKPLVNVALSEAYLMSKDWESLKSQVKFGGWKDLEFQRLALFARVIRESGDLPGATLQWKAAAVATNGRVEDLATLARLATTWKWQDEANLVLWQIARGTREQMPALQSLSRNFQLAGNTHELLAVANRMVELNPDSTHAKNNVAYLSLLLETDKERAYEFAKEVFVTDPTNPAFVSTYALGLHQIGKSEAAIKLMEELPRKTLEEPSTAFSYGVLLAALNKREEGAHFLSLAEKSSLLLPQEKTILAQAREWISKP